MPLLFHPNERILTLGAEMELQVLDRSTLQLTPKAPDLLRAMSHPRLTKEMFRSTLELITGICDDASSIREDLALTLKEVKQAGNLLDVTFAGTGTHPTSHYDERQLSQSDRYQVLMDRNQWLIRRMAVYGLHVHIGMPNGDHCIRYENFFLHFIPHLIALSASSPYWIGKDTGLVASRPTVYEAHPTAGRPVVVQSWQAFSDLYDQMIKTHSIESMKDIWWDLRPSPVFGTLEIRICDGPASLDELEAIVAFIHLLAHWFADNMDDEAFSYMHQPPVWIMRENKWRSIRFGTQANLIRWKTLEEISLADSIYRWQERLEPYIRQLRYEPQMDLIGKILSQGNSAVRQKKVFQQTSDMMEVIRHNIREFELGTPLWE